MTAEQPQRERCSFEGMCYLCNTGGHCTVDDAIPCGYDSRPNPPAPEKIFTSEECNDLCVQAADTAREAATLAENKRVLDILSSLLLDDGYVKQWDGTLLFGRSIGAQKIWEKVESLRSTAAQEDK
jgi:hypothetical protein